MQPYNYNIQQPDYVGSVARGFSIGDKIRSRVITDNKEQIALNRQAETERQLIELSKNPTLENIQSAVIRNPSLSDKFKPIIDRMGEAEKTSQANHAYQVLSALENNRGDIAKRLFDDKAKALENSGKSKEAAGMRSMSNMVDKYPELVKSESVFLLNSLQGMEKLSENLAKFKSIDPDIAKKEAETRDISADIKGKEQTIAQKDASFVTDLEKKKADLKKTQTDTQKMLDEMKAIKDRNGKIPVEDIPEWEVKLANQYQKEAGDFIKIDRQFKDLMDSNMTGAGGLSMILSFMKMKDPTSVVSSTEKASAENAPGWGPAAIAIYNKAFSAGEVSEETAKQFKKEARSIWKNAKAPADRSRNRIMTQAKDYGLNTDHIFNPLAPVIEYPEDEPREVVESTPRRSAPSPSPVAAPPASSGMKFLGWE